MKVNNLYKVRSQNVASKATYTASAISHHLCGRNPLPSSTEIHVEETEGIRSVSVSDLLSVCSPQGAILFEGWL